MTTYIARRLLQMIPVLLGISIIVFLLVRLGGDPVLNLVPDYFTEEQIAAVRADYGFDRPIVVQYLEFIGRAVQGNFGYSFHHRQPAWDMVAARLPRTAQLAFAAIVMSIVVSVPLGILAALKRNTMADVLITGLSVWGRSLPNFWLGIMFILLFAVTLGWFPVSGTGEFSNRPFIAHLFLPALTLAFGLITTLTRLVRSAMLEVLREDHVRTARAKGQSETVVVLRHVLRNALIPVVTVLGLQIGWLLGGAVIIEDVFAWPGLGRLMLTSIMARDNSVVQAALLVSAIIIMLSNLLVDVTYTFLDPRIRYA
ncbi:MAG: ABC transporter permease [bacterium]|nr:ABC transporter permease [bacterium]